MASRSGYSVNPPRGPSGSLRAAFPALFWAARRWRFRVSASGVMPATILSNSSGDTRRSAAEVLGVLQLLPAKRLPVHPAWLDRVARPSPRVGDATAGNVYPSNCQPELWGDHSRGHEVEHHCRSCHPSWYASGHLACGVCWHCAGQLTLALLRTLLRHFQGKFQERAV